jgi:hypothetical protein
MKPILACILLMGLATTSVSGQTVVRLEVESESWLSPTPFDVRAEVTKRLRDASIEVSDAADAPLVQVSYVERPALTNKPGEALATLLSFGFKVRRLDGARTDEEIGIHAETTRDGTAEELRLRAIQALVDNKRFALLGHRVGAALGINASFRALVDAEPPSPYKTILYENLLNALSWSPDVDDLCQLSLEAVRGVSNRGAKYVSDRSERFLKRNLSVLQSSTSQTMRAPLLAIDVLSEYGERASSQVLNDLMVNPQLAGSAYNALQRIEARANGIVR